MASWEDIERNLDRLEDLDEATLEEFARVMPPLSHNRNFDRRFEQAQLRIRRRLDRFASERASAQNSDHNRGEDKWYKKPVGILFLTVAGGLLLALIKYVLGI